MADRLNGMGAPTYNETTNALGEVVRTNWTPQDWRSYNDGWCNAALGYPTREARHNEKFDLGVRERRMLDGEQKGAA